MLFVVVLICHSSVDVTANFFIKAQDRGMMDGDYAWLQFSGSATQAVLQPWTATKAYSGTDSGYRLTALYAVNLVSRRVTDHSFFLFYTMSS
jgi:hypothetical protein